MHPSQISWLMPSFCLYLCLKLMYLASRPTETVTSYSYLSSYNAEQS